MLKEIIDYMVSYGTNETLYGNYCFEIEELEEKFNIKLTENDINNIQDLLKDRKEIADVDYVYGDELEEIEIYFYLNYCPNLESDYDEYEEE